MTVLVVGAGICGLAAARELGRAGIPTLLVESAPTVGGKIATERTGGFIIERGPDSFLTTRPAALTLCRELGLADQLMGVREPRAVFILRDGRPIRMPDGLGLVLPTKVRPFVTTRLFGWSDKARMALDLVLPRVAAPGDESVGAFLRHRLGSAMVDRLAGPLVGGIYGTSIDDLSLNAVVPTLREAERRHRSLLLAGLSDGRRARAARAAHPPGEIGQLGLFATLADGLDVLVDALVRSIEATRSVEIRRATAVIALGRAGAGLNARLSDGSAIAVDAAIIATPGPSAAQLVEPLSPAASRALAEIPHGSSTVVTLAWRRERIPAMPPGHGILLPRTEQLPISALTFSSQKWSNRAPDDAILVRAFLPDEPALGRSDDELVELARRGVKRVLGIAIEPELLRVDRYRQTMPRYTVGHLARVGRIEAALEGLPLAVAGAPYRGVGLPDCIADGQAKANEVAHRLGGVTAAGSPLMAPAEARAQPAPMGS